jgi:hypothetical protein
MSLPLVVGDREAEGHSGRDHHVPGCQVLRRLHPGGGVAAVLASHLLGVPVLSAQQAGERVVDVAAVPRAGHEVGGVARVPGEKVQPAVLAGEDQVGAGAGDLS